MLLNARAIPGLRGRRIQYAFHQVLRQYSSLKPNILSESTSDPVDTAADDLQASNVMPAQPTSLDALFKMQSKRRVFGSPVLPLEAVAVHGSVQTSIEKALKATNLTQRKVRKSSVIVDSFVAPETAAEKRQPKPGVPLVRAPPEYGTEEAIAYVATRSAGTLATNVYVMSEIRRCLPSFRPESILDFGAGIGVSVMAAARVFNEDPFDAIAGYLEQLSRLKRRREDTSSKSKKDRKEGGRSFITRASLVDQSTAMRALASEVLPADENVGTRVKLMHAASLKEAPRGNPYDIVCASYSLNEIVREAMSNPSAGEDSDKDQSTVSREERVNLAEKRLKRYVRSLWSRTAPGGVLVLVEDGTAAGFETVLFARDTILRMNSSQSAEDAGNSETEDGSLIERNMSGNELDHSSPGANTAKVVAPCLHSKKCPLQGSITRHRVCRFQQRINRPPFLRNARPLPTGHEDEYFSYIVIQKVSHANKEEKRPELPVDPWGRIVRSPLTKGKHVILDACTVDGTLERRVVSKKNAIPGHYSRARKAKWGDIWPIRPRSDPQPVNF